MKRVWKKISTYAFVALFSVGVTFATYSILSGSSYGIADYYDYKGDFEQDNVHLAALTAEGYPDFTKAAENAVHAVVHIKSVVKSAPSSRQQRMVDPFEYFFGFGGRGDRYQYEPQPSVGFGSGVIISKDGYIITNNHVIDKANDIEVTLNDNSKYTAKLIGTDPTTDIALLKIEGNDFPTIPFGDSDKLKIGEWVLAVGNPFNLTSTVTAGIVSAKSRGGITSNRRNTDGTAQNSIQSYIQTDAAINRGNSGGALVNTAGQLVGINTAIYSQTGDFAGYGFAVPISIAGKVVADLKEYGAVQRAVLGITIIDLSVMKSDEKASDDVKKIKTNEGVYVNDFSDRSPAREAGMDKGDVIIAVNDVKVRNTGELQEQISRFRPGNKVKITYLRNNAEKTANVTLKTSSGDTKIIKKTDGLAIAGAAFKTLSGEKLKELGIRNGVEVAGVDSDGKFKAKGISKGFIIQKINNQSVSTAEDVESIIESVGRSEDKVLFISGFYPSGARRYYAVELGE